MSAAACRAPIENTQEDDSQHACDENVALMSDGPLLFRVPGFRRYGAQLARLRGRLDETRRELEALRSAFHQAAPDRELLTKAKHYHYYLVNAEKKIDLREMPGFGELAHRIRCDGRTYLDFDRLYTLWQAVLSMPVGASAVAEVGVYRGGSTRFLAETLRRHGRDQVVLYACDTFEGHTHVDESIDGAHQPGVQFRHVNVRKVAKYLKGLDNVQLVRGDIRTTSAAFEHERAFGLAHIDVDVYPITRFCLEFFAPRMVPGGVIVVDDYGTLTCRGVQKSVDEFATQNPQFRLIHVLTGQALLVRLA